MYGLFQTAFYFGYMALFSLSLGLMCATMGYVGTSIFVRKIYSTVKIDWEKKKKNTKIWNCTRLFCFFVLLLFNGVVNRLYKTDMSHERGKTVMKIVI